MVERKANAQRALISAYMRGELKHCEPCACAVGILADGTSIGYGRAKYSGAAGYNFAHIRSIEMSFEFIKLGKSAIDHDALIKSDQDGFLGLTAVFETLDKIDPEVALPVDFFNLKFDVV